MQYDLLLATSTAPKAAAEDLALACGGHNVELNSCDYVELWQLKAFLTLNII